MDDNGDYYQGLQPREEVPVTGAEYVPEIEQDIFRGPLYWGNYF